ncbi:unnamed protein product [[Candida] boidinii]|nr:unnamed protein product [[Candida] boidinii]
MVEQVPADIQPVANDAATSANTAITATTASDVLKSETPAVKRGNSSHNGNGNGNKKPKVKKRKIPKVKVELTSPMGILLNKEIPELISNFKLTKELITNPLSLILNDNEIFYKYNRIVNNVTILKFTSNGEGLAIIDHPDLEISEKGGKQIVIIPFAFPGDIVKIKIHLTKETHCEADLLEIIKESDLRKLKTSEENDVDNLNYHGVNIRCKYYGRCSGCQLQPLDYEYQLELKRETIKNAYKFFAINLNLNNKIPEIGETISSPLQFEYRSKLTPHYNISRKSDKRPNIGFSSRGRPNFRSDIVPVRDYPGEVMDIEDCIMGTPIVREGLTRERNNLIKNFEENDGKLKHRSATILLREDTLIENQGLENEKITKNCCSEHNSIVSEYVNGLRFKFIANEFFQNNNSILPKVIDYVSQKLSFTNDNSNGNGDGELDNYLVDAYCGCGLFSISLSKHVKQSLGVEVSALSVKFAKENVKINNIQNCDFIHGKAEELFKSIDFPKDKTSCILDPPRKGCDEVFLNQLSDFNPLIIIYISCNVHSQARDIEFFLNNTKNGKNYEIESIRGFDFFPQTHHVESIAVLKRVSN